MNVIDATDGQEQQGPDGLEATLMPADGWAGRAVVVVVATGYVPRRRWGEDERAGRARVEESLQQATRYLVQSARHGVDARREIFAPRAQALSLAEARAQIAAHYGPRAAFHGLVLSPHPRLDLLATGDLTLWTRRLMDAAGRRLERRLVWVGAVHHDTAVAHVHLVLAGADHEARPVRLRPPLFAAMRWNGRVLAEELGRERDRRRDLGAY